MRRKRVTMLSDFQHLLPVNQDGHTIRRSASFVNDRPVVLFHKQGTSLAPTDEFDWCKLLSRLNCGPVVELESLDWAWSQQSPINFNCHALAIGSVIGVTPNDWLEGVASPATLDQNPVELILDQYFDLLSIRSCRDQVSFSEMMEDDAFVFCNSYDSHFIHSGFVKIVENQVVAISKFGEGPILMTSMELIRKFYSGKFNEVRWYRFKGEQPAPESVIER